MKTKVKMGHGLACISVCFVIAFISSPMIGVVVITPAAVAGIVRSVWSVSQILALALAALLLTPTLLPFCIHKAWAWWLPFIIAIISSIGAGIMFLHNVFWADRWGFTLIGPSFLACYAFSIGMESLAIKTTARR